MNDLNFMKGKYSFWYWDIIYVLWNLLMVIVSVIIEVIFIIYINVLKKEMVVYFYGYFLVFYN